MLGLYLHRQSPVHSLPAGAKLLALFAAATGLFYLVDPLAQLAVALTLPALFALARLSPAIWWGQLRPLMLLLAILFLAQGFLGDWLMACAITLRAASLMLLAALVTLTTRADDMIDAVERVLRLARPIGVNPAKVSLMMVLTIRLVPVLVSVVEEIRTAQRARGAERSGIALLVPLMVKILRLGDQLAEALEARGYDPR